MVSNCVYGSLFNESVVVVVEEKKNTTPLLRVEKKNLKYRLKIYGEKFSKGDDDTT